MGPARLAGANPTAGRVAVTGNVPSRSEGGRKGRTPPKCEKRLLRFLAVRAGAATREDGVGACTDTC